MITSKISWFPVIAQIAPKPLFQGTGVNSNQRYNYLKYDF